MKKYILKRKKQFLKAALLAGIVAALNVYGAYRLGDLLTAAGEGDAQKLVKSLAVIIMIWGMMYVMDCFRKNRNAGIRACINSDIRNDQAEFILSMKIDMWENKAPSEYENLFLSQVDMIDRNCIDPLLDIVYSTFTFVLSFIALCMIHWSVMILAVAMYILMIILPKLFEKKLSSLAQNSAEENEKMTGTIHDCLYCRNEYTAYDENRTFLKRISNSSINSEENRYQYEKGISSSAMWIGIVGFLCQCALICSAALLSVFGYTAIGSVLTVGNLAGTFTQSISLIVNDLTKIKSTKNLFPSEPRQERIREIDDIYPLKIQNLKEIRIGQSFIRFNVDNWTFEKNGKYLIAGESGSGKSTLIRALFHNDYTYEGVITAGTENRNEFSYTDMMEYVAYAEQRPVIFRDTLRYNLTMGKDVSEEEMERVISFVNLDHFYESCDRNPDYILGDGGDNISGGEKQRISLARVILSKRELLVLDELFSGLDEQNRSDLLRKCLQLKDRTVIVIAHNIPEEERGLFDRVYTISENS